MIDSMRRLDQSSALSNFVSILRLSKSIHGSFESKQSQNLRVRLKLLIRLNFTRQEQA